MEWGSRKGFTIVELLIVVVVIAILAAITFVAYSGIQAQAKTSSSLATVEQVSQKAAIWNTLQSSYPDLAQLRTNSINPVDMDTAGNQAGPVEAKLSSPSIIMGADITEVRAEGGHTVFYAPCSDGSKFSGATIGYWNYTISAPVIIITGTCP